MKTNPYKFLPICKNRMIPIWGSFLTGKTGLNTMTKYYEVIATIDGEIDTLFGSFMRADCVGEIDAEKHTWKGEGYKGIKIVSRETTEQPDREVYKDDAIIKQADIYTEMQSLNLTDELEKETDYFLVDEIDGIKYYSPNDEDLGAIIAVSYEHQLAIYTGFYEMDDMEVEDSDYAIVFHGGTLCCRFEAE